MENFTFHNPCKIIFGKDTVKNVGKETSYYGRKILLVTGGGSVKRYGVYDIVINNLKSYNLEIFEISGIQPNPRVSSVYKGIEICRREQIDFILALGGGSVIDAAKAMAVGAKYDGDVWDFFVKKAEINDALPLGTILTIAGTGSEMNVFSVITNWETREKRSIASPYIIPKFSVLDPTLTFTVLKNQTVYGIVDSMAHVFEQYFSPTKDTALQDRMAEAVLRTIIETAPAVLDNPTDYEVRASMMWCATMAFNTLIGMGKIRDGASHAIEHEVSALYDIPHAAGMAVIFPNWMKYVMDEDIAKFKQFAERVWGISPEGKDEREMALLAIEKTREFFTGIGAPATLGEFDIGSENIPLMAEKAVKFGPVGNFKRLGKEDVENILRMCL